MITPEEVLDIPMNPGDNDAGASKVGQYLVKLLLAVWEEGEGFSGKRPFGNSSWEWELYTALMDAGVVEAKIDKYGEAGLVDRRKADKLIADAIRCLA